MIPSRRALRAVPVALAAGLFLAAQKPTTFTEQVEVREVELVVDLAGPAAGKPLLEKFNAESHPGDFHQGVIVNGGRLLYLAGQVANNPDGSVAGIGDWRRQAEKVYENIGHVLRAAGGSPASAVKETTWVLDIDAWRKGGAAVRRAFYNGDWPASTLVEIPGLASPEFLVEIEVIAAIA